MTSSTSLLGAALPAPAADLLASITAHGGPARAAAPHRLPDDVTTRRTSAAALAAALAANAAAWTDLVEYQAHSRWTHLLDPATAAAALDPALHDDLAAAQIWLLSWMPQQGTPLHDHGGSAGAFAVVSGALTELTVTDRGDGGVRDSEAALTAGRVRPFGPHHVHQVTNTGTVPAVSVHVYEPRLTVMNTYRIAGCGLLQTGSERAGVDW
ncbi:cysteine dioxygenase family protein [Blastococcus sp. URHD0036]|uniref:cysteine dioxygenase n=1 Tax=Blastococcus sp. URHD0036 TaxID=1380356 RepID=UPI000690914A|nr:cysteine dioxygenase family protein [Blastococcus sp. URHD0036]